MKNLIFLSFLFLFFTSIHAQNFTLDAIIKHPKNVVFLGEKIELTLSNNGQKILADEVSVNGIIGGNKEIGTITKPTTAGVYKYVYTAPDILPEKPFLAISMTIKNAKGEKISMVKNICVMAKVWNIYKTETTEITCGELNKSISYTMLSKWKTSFVLDDNLNLSTTVNPTTLPQQLNDVTTCDPQFTVEITPGKGEYVRFKSGKLVLTSNSFYFKLDIVNIPSTPGFSIHAPWGNITDSKPDEDSNEADFSMDTPIFSFMKKTKGGWSDETKPQGTETMKSSYEMIYAPDPNFVISLPTKL